MWAFQKSIREAVFFLGCHPRKKIERKGLEKSAFSVELPQNWCSPSYPPVQSSWSLPVQKYKVCLIFVFDIGIDHPLCKKMGLFDIWYFAVMYIVYLIVMIICCSVKRRRACFQNKLNMKIFLLYFIIEYENLLIVF